MVEGNSKVEIELNMDESRCITASAYIEYTQDLIEEALSFFDQEIEALE